MPTDHYQNQLHNTEVAPTINAALANNFGVSLYRLPGESDFHLVYGPCDSYSLSEIHQQPLFLVSPFEMNESVLAIQPTEVFPLELAENAPLPWHSREKQEESLSKEAYKKIVRYGVEQIKAGSFDKVVATNKQITDLPDQFDALNYFQQLEQTYPNAFVHLTSTPQYGTWLGASPELLLAFDNNCIYTEAIAGTIGSGNDDAFTEKEEQEQNLVAEYIEHCFENLAFDYEKTGPKIVKAGNLNHLKTYYHCNLNGETGQNWQQMLKCLHPTPAVCGHPYSVTRIFIRNEEPFNRELFTGFLGPINFGDTSSLYVNLRSMEIHGKQASIYAGAGIVKGSQSEEEYEETLAKMQTLMDLLEN